jgi:calcineurin-like phosphoesterase family protein
MAPLRIVHVGDLHFWRLPLNPLSYLGKRMLGVGNLIAGRRFLKFRQKLAPELAARLAEVAPDLLAFSGDFTSTAIASEFAAARAALSPAVAAAGEAIMVPGNHDCYTHRQVLHPRYLRLLPAEFGPTAGVQWRRLGPDSGLIAINATTSNGMGSHGAITPATLAAMREQLAAVGRLENLVILCHFPAEDPPGVLPHDRGPQLRGECEAMLATLAAAPAQRRLWLHGHHHWRWLYGSPRVPGLVYVNAGAPLMRFGGRSPDLGFHELHIEPGQPVDEVTTHWRLTVGEPWRHRTTRLPAKGAFIDLQHH